MARQTVVQFKCSRCPRVETAPSDAPPRGVRVYSGDVASGAQTPPKPDILLEELCMNCWHAVTSALGLINKKLEKESPARGKERKTMKKAEPPPPTPPPQPGPRPAAAAKAAVRG